MKTVLTGLFVLMVITARGLQPKLSHVDSLESKFKSLKPGAAKNFVEQQLFFFYLNNDSKKALNIAKTALAEAEQLKRDSDICFFYDCIGEANLYLENLDEALTYLQKDYDLAKKINYRQQAALALTDMSGAYQSKSDYITAQSCSFRSLSIYEQLKDYRQMAICYHNIGITYYNNNDFKKAIVYAKKAMDIIKGTSHPDIVANAYMLIANSFISLKNIVAARSYFNGALVIYQKNKNDFGTANILSQLAATYPHDYEKQVEVEMKAKQLWDKISPENFNAIYNLGNLGSVYGQMAMRTNSPARQKFLFGQSVTYLNEAICLAKKTGTKAAVIDFRDSLSVINSAMGNYKDAYANLKASSTLYDSVYSQENKNTIASLEGKHELDLKDKQLQINKLEISAQTRQKWFLTAGIFTLLVIALLIYYQNVQRRRTNTKLVALNHDLDKANKTITQFFSILNHDLRRPVANFITFLNLQQNQPELLPAAAQDSHVEKITASAEHLLETMEDLLLWTKGQMENFKPQVKVLQVKELMADIEQIFEGAGATLKFDCEQGLTIQTDEHYLKTIMQNLTSNAVNATETLANATITWRAWRAGDTIFLSIKDNGPGTTKEKLAPLYDLTAPIGVKNGLGLHIVRDMAKAIACNITVNYANEGIGILLAFTNS